MKNPLLRLYGEYKGGITEMRNFLLTYERWDKYENLIGTYSDRFNSKSEAEKDIEENNRAYGEDYIYKLVSIKELSKEVLNQYIIDEIEKYSDKVLETIEIDNIQIFKIESEHNENKEIEYKPYLDYERIGTIYSTLEDAILGAIIHKHLEVNEARYTHTMINRMLKK
jgi:hypothetical protein